jgi:Flp pilus assembly secretin CpaC
MTTLCVAGQAAKNALHWFAAAVLAAAIAAQAAPQAAAQPPDQMIVARLDEATLFKLPDRAATVVIGNPLIADVTIEPGNVAVVTGKGYGVTNVVVMDSGGVVLMEKALVVSSPPGQVVFVYRGVARTTYGCNPDCSVLVNLGDDPEVFAKNLAEITSRTTQAMSAGSNTTAR